MTKLDHALKLAAEGFYVFPLAPGKKTPVLKQWQHLATRDPDLIDTWWGTPDTVDQNIGIFTGKFGDDGALLVVDVDQKKGKDGNAELLRLELDGHDLPATREQRTPSGGRHLLFRVDQPVKSSAGLLAPGLDVRSAGGFIVGAGSVVPAGGYETDQAALAPAPEWLVARCGSPRTRTRQSVPGPAVASQRAAERAIRYLRDEAPLAVEGEGGDTLTYRVACRLKDMGVPADPDAIALMWEHWNDRCSPPWTIQDLCQKVRNAYEYGIDPPGVAAPEADFPPATPSASNDAQHPFDEFNKQYAYIVQSDQILWQTTDVDGVAITLYLNMKQFERKHAADKFQVGNKSRPLVDEWMEWKGRRTFDGIVFRPRRDVAARWFNLWCGFRCTPLAPGEAPDANAQAALDAWKEHLHENVCRGDAEVTRWLTGYFAHMIQRPGDKPLVALAFKGAKGVGKNACVERVGDLLGPHFMVADDDRYLLSNFNGHMENLLFFVLDEAAWAGDKKAEGRLKGLITGKKHNIEPKGAKSYSVDNLVRLAVLGNEDWIVPASHDERRWAVFDVGAGRRLDTQFFEDMRVRMDAGGNRALLRYLLDFDIAGLNFNLPPLTQALLEQKVASLDPVAEWWLECLTEGHIVLSDFGAEWPEQIETARFRSALQRYARERNVKGRLPSSVATGKLLAKFGLSHGRVTRKGGEQPYVYRVPPLEEARALWDRYMGQRGAW